MMVCVKELEALLMVIVAALPNVPALILMPEALGIESSAIFALAVMVE